MRLDSLLMPALLAPFLSCAVDTDTEAVDRERSEFRSVQGLPAHPDVLAFDVVQHTCAMYVAARARAWEEPIAFGRDIDDVPVHWNKCPGGEMIACAVTSTADGDTVITGIPWP
ncbi:MAG: hypothetical protein H6597_05425 [Flavobacteriales bacterium]|nr:hypothetical protein [Flavobacteriales bacterium]MCB9193956.1 hypothetical protein [Flavobacteriales bacterium]